MSFKSSAADSNMQPGLRREEEMDRAKRGASDTKPREAANVRGSEHTGHSGPRQRGRRAGGQVCERSWRGVWSGEDQVVHRLRGSPLVTITSLKGTVTTAGGISGDCRSREPCPRPLPPVLLASTPPASPSTPQAESPLSSPP